MPATPRIVLAYGLLGVLPFLAPPVVTLALPDWRGAAATVVVAYGALILSFLGGARWGLAVARPDPGAGVITLAMLPTLAALAIVMLPDTRRALQLAALAVLLLAHFAWDRVGRDLPAWYPRLRALLTAGAVTGLAAQAALVA